MDFFKSFIIGCLNEGNPRPEILKWILAQKGWLLVWTTEPNQEYYFQNLGATTMNAKELEIYINNEGTENGVYQPTIYHYALYAGRAENKVIISESIEAKEFLPFLAELFSKI